MGKDPKPQILIIDDERGPRESLRILLKHDYDLLLADNVDDGVELLKENDPQAVVLDIRMPDKNGIEGLQEIRELDPDVAAIILTGYGELETAQEAIRHGASEYMKKPFDAVDMMDVIARNVERTQVNKRRNSAEHKLQELEGRLKGMLGEKEQMASLGLASSAFAHDLRNPLMVILAYVDMLTTELRSMGDKESRNINGEIEDYLDNIEKNVQRCNKLAKDWNLLGKPDTIKFERISLNEVMADISKNAKVMASDRNRIEIGMKPLPPDMCVMGEPSLLERAFMNLAKNAVQAAEMEDNGKVSMGVEDRGGVYSIAIADNGCGIAPEKIESIFEPLKSDKEINDSFGLGLFITKEVIEQHNGEISFASEEGVGTKVTVTLPKASQTA